jgi:hypothetical protein
VYPIAQISSRSMNRGLVGPELVSATTVALACVGRVRSMNITTSARGAGRDDLCLNPEPYASGLGLDIQHQAILAWAKLNGLPGRPVACRRGRLRLQRSRLPGRAPRRPRGAGLARDLSGGGGRRRGRRAFTRQLLGDLRRHGSRGLLLLRGGSRQHGGRLRGPRPAAHPPRSWR